MNYLGNRADCHPARTRFLTADSHPSLPVLAIPGPDLDQSRVTPHPCTQPDPRASRFESFAPVCSRHGKTAPGSAGEMNLRNLAVQVFFICLTVAGSAFVQPASANTFTPILVHAGGGAYTDSLGQTWSADTGFSGGNVYSTTSPINNTPDPTLYQTCLLYTSSTSSQ